MLKRNTAASMALSTLFFTTLCLLSSAVTAHAQAEPQQGAINTTRSNIKNTSRTAGGRFDPLVLDLTKGSGEKIASRRLVDSDGDGKLSDSEGEFDFGILPEGEYVLTITVGADADGATSRAASQGKPQAEASAVSAPSNITVTLIGAKGGSIKKDLALAPPSPGADTARTKLDNKIDAAEAPLSEKLFGPGRPRYGNIRFETDGKSEAKGALRHDMAKSSIRNMR